MQEASSLTAFNAGDELGPGELMPISGGKKK